MDDAARRAELATSLAEVRERIARACAAAGRPADAVTLVAVTKTYPASDVVLLAGLGVTEVGENRDQEAAAKAAEVRAAGAATALALRRAAAAQQGPVGGRLRGRGRVGRLGAARGRWTGRPRGGTPRWRCWCRSSIDGDPERGGAAGDELWRTADAVAAADNLRLGGLMAVAPLGWAPDRAFEELAELSGRLVAAHPAATAISAGMSNDLEAAVRHGATHVRIGTSLLGMRKTLR